MTTLLLIRHGQNDWVSKNQLAGWTPGVHLNEEGRNQATRLAERLANVKLTAIYSSPLERAVETAEPLAERYNLKIEIREGLGEIGFGDWTGQPLSELAKTELWQAVQYYPSTVRFPNGESFREAQFRGLNALDEIIAAHPEGVVAIVSHADLLKLLVSHYLGEHMDQFQRLVISPASVSVVVSGKGRPSVQKINDTGVLSFREDRDPEGAVNPAPVEEPQALLVNTSSTQETDLLNNPREGTKLNA